MKNAIRNVNIRYSGQKLIDEKLFFTCGHCDSGEVYVVKKKNAIYCRKCGQESKLPRAEE